jgi:hypothetical protein
VSCRVRNNHWSDPACLLQCSFSGRANLYQFTAHLINSHRSHSHPNRPEALADAVLLLKHPSAGCSSGRFSQSSQLTFLIRCDPCRLSPSRHHRSPSNSLLRFVSIWYYRLPTVEPRLSPHVYHKAPANTPARDLHHPNSCRPLRRLGVRQKPYHELRSHNNRGKSR